MDEETYRGYVWDPSSFHDKQPGFLQLSEDGSVALELINGFPISRLTTVEEAGGVLTQDVEHMDPPAMVLGEAGGYLFSLLRCTLRRSHGFSKPESQTLNVGLSLRGVHLTSADQNAFYGVQAEIEYLPFWAARSGIQHA